MNKPVPGKNYTLTVERIRDQGVYLTGDILLPRAQVAEGTKVGDAIEVFIYLDSEDRLIATTRTPAITLGQVARLRVAQTSRIGVWLDWGLEKDLLLPFAEQTSDPAEGEWVLVALYTDKSGRLCATQKLYPYLGTRSPYVVGDTVRGVAYEDSERFGIFVAVDDRYQGLIPRRECFGDITLGKELECRIITVREDGKLDLASRARAYETREDDAGRIRQLLVEYDGTLPFSERATPEVIKLHTGMSKAQFKRAVGYLLKAGEITIEEGVISLLS